MLSYGDLVLNILIIQIGFFDGHYHAMGMFELQSDISY